MKELTIRLRRHDFVKLSLQIRSLKLVHPWRIARRSQSSNSCEVFDIDLTDRNGVTGRGESAPSNRYHESVQSGSEFIQSVDLKQLSFDRVTDSLAYLDRLTGGENAARCALSLAILDGAAKLASQPLHQFLGLRWAERQQVTSYSIGIDSPETIRRKVLSASDYPILKLKVGLPGDRESLAALREAAPQKLVRVDANEGWKTKEEALAQIEWLAADGRIQFVEQPMPAKQSVSDWRWLKARSPLPIFADESFRSAADIPQCVDCFHGVNVKLVKTGGIHGAISALKAARTAGLKTMLGCMVETSLLISAAAHLAEMSDYLDLDGNLLITNDPFCGVTAKRGVMSFADAPERYGLRVSPRR